MKAAGCLVVAAPTLLWTRKRWHYKFVPRAFDELLDRLNLRAPIPLETKALVLTPSFNSKKSIMISCRIGCSLSRISSIRRICPFPSRELSRKTWL